MHRLTPLILAPVLLLSLLTLGPTACTEHYRIDPDTGERKPISSTEYRRLKEEGPGYELNR